MDVERIVFGEIYTADSFAKIREVPDHSIDVILTDPPYNLGMYSTGNIKMSWRSDFNNDIAHWDHETFEPAAWVGEFRRILKPSGNIFGFTSYNQLGDWHRAFDPVFDTFQFMVWHKTNPAPKLRRAGFLNSCELIVCAWNKGHRWNFGRQTGAGIARQGFVDGEREVAVVACRDRSRLVVGHRTIITAFVPRLGGYPQTGGSAPGRALQAGSATAFADRGTGKQGSRRGRGTDRFRRATPKTARGIVTVGRDADRGQGLRRLGERQQVEPGPQGAPGCSHRMRQHVVDGVEREDPKGLRRVGRVAGAADAVLAAVLNVPLEREAGEDKGAPIVVAIGMEFVVARQHR